MFEVGKTYKRREQIHLVYGGQSQGGISTPSKHDMVLLFSSDAGENYGYENQFRSDGSFWYTGEGQIGHMEMLRGNAAIHNHKKSGKELHLFEYVKKGYVRYIGEAQYVGHHIEERLDREGKNRNAIIFHLALLNKHKNKPQKNLHSTVDKPTKNHSLSELRELAQQASMKKASTKQVARMTSIRSLAIRLYALKRSNGICEGCKSPAPFQSKDGPFLEVHHLLRLSDGGPDEPKNIIALCPNCHRRVHLSLDGDNYNKKLIKLIKKIEASQDYVS